MVEVTPGTTSTALHRPPTSSTHLASRERATYLRKQMADTTFSDEWLAHSLEGVVTPELLAELREKADPTAKERVPEQVARRYHILPFRATDSYLEIATANPFDLDAEKALAFATAREIRMLLLAPSKIAERLDEMYRPEKAVDKLL